LHTPVSNPHTGIPILHTVVSVSLTPVSILPTGVSKKAADGFA
jgi:hypothetical protein